VQNFNRGYGYDSLNRLASMSDVAPQPCQGLTWTIDAWGNMTAQTTTAGSCNSFSSSVNTNNQLQSGYQYDAAGNVTYDGVHHYTYDAENRIIQVDSGSTATYVYNENGQRVRKSTAPGAFTEFFYGPNGQVQSVYNGSGWPAEYVFAGSRLIADYTNGTTDFVLTDHLGSTRLMTGVNQAVLSNMDYMPYGQQIAGGSATTDKFTGQEYDSESGLYQFPFRYYESPMGRFMTPDPAGLAAADPTNPQSWNRYAYVMNSPASLVDLLGLNPGGPAGTGGCQGYACGSQNYCGGGGFTGGGASPCLSSDCNLTIDGGAPAPCSLGMGTGTLSTFSGINFAPPQGNWAFLGPGDVTDDILSYAPGTLVDLDTDQTWSPSDFLFAANNGTNNVSCNSTTGICVPSSMMKPRPAGCGAAVAQGAISFGLDVVGAIPGVGNAVSATAAGARAVNGIVAYGGAAYGIATGLPDENPFGAASAGAGLGLTLADSALEGGKVIPGLGNFLSVVTGLYDGYQLGKTIARCW
jgi:RHS repeat-associated protein